VAGSPSPASLPQRKPHVIEGAGNTTKRHRAGICRRHDIAPTVAVLDSPGTPDDTHFDHTGRGEGR